MPSASPAVSNDPLAISRTAHFLYQDASLFGRTVMRGRPYICPFEELTKSVPQGSTILDIGCGSGLFLGWLAAHGRIGKGIGVEPNPKALEAAGRMRKRLAEFGSKVELDFRRVSSEQDWPDGQFDVVSSVDVMHHVSLDAREAFFQRAVDLVRPGGVLLYKDMAPRPRLFALWNQMHDLVMAREWIRLQPIASVEAWAANNGLRLERSEPFHRVFYSHELRVYRKPE
jgi:SAM-dependent methyltransferase